MLADLMLGPTVIIVNADDSYHVPQVERTVLEGNCYEREIKLTEQRGALTLSVDNKEHDIATTSFAKSYVLGSYLGRFTYACRKDGKGFSVNFLGVEIPQSGPPRPSAGSVSYDKTMSVSSDSPIKYADDINLYRFNIRRSEYWLP
jgi:hypothetical protein